MSQDQNSIQRLNYRAMDQLEQRCHDLDAKVRRVEEERDAVMMENDELHDKIAVISQLRSVSRSVRPRARAMV